MTNAFTDIFKSAQPPPVEPTPMQMPVININVGNAPARKQITTSRDAAGNLQASVSEVSEEVPPAEVQKGEDPGSVFRKVASKLRDRLFQKSATDDRTGKTFRKDSPSVGGVHVTSTIGNSDPKRRKKPKDVIAELDAEMEGADAEKNLGDEKPRRDSFTPYGSGPAHYRLHARFWEIKQAKPDQLPMDSYQEAWNSITEADRSELRRAGAVPDDDTHKSLDKEPIMQDSLAEIAKRHGLPALAKHLAEHGSDGAITESAFVKMITDSGEDISQPEFYRAAKRLHDEAQHSYDARWNPDRSHDPAYVEELTKYARELKPQGGVPIAITEPVVGDGSSQEAAIAQLKALMEREARDFPFLPPERIRARCEAAMRAHQAIANAKRPRQIV
jgi:hypothetical protein